MSPTCSLVRCIILMIICSAACCVLSPESRAATDTISINCSFPTQGEDLPSILAACQTILDRRDLSDSERAQILKVHGRVSHLKGDLKRAISDFEAAIALAPNDAELRMRRGWTAFDEQDYDHVFRLVQQAFVCDPSYAGAFDLQGAAAATTGQFEIARAAYDKAVKLAPNSLFFGYHRFQLLRQTGDYSEAFKATEDMLRSGAPDLDAPTQTFKTKKVSYRVLLSLERAGILDQLDRPGEAKAGYDALIAAAPGAVSYSARAGHFFNNGQVTLAHADLAKAMDYDTTYGFAYLVLGSINLLQEGNFSQALRNCTQSIVHDPREGYGYWCRAAANRGLKRLDEAQADAIKATEIDHEFVNRKIPRLMQLGYFRPPRAGTDPMLAIREAVTACMADPKCF